jgi:SAM-dependent methyltransferase
MADPDAPSNREWARWGETDPFWGVATWPGRDRDGEHPWTPEEFYAVGASDWQDFRRCLERFGVENHDLALEIGCGAGRLTMHIGRDFRRVIAADVAAGMLRMAREHVTDEHIDFRLGNGLTLPTDSGIADVVVSTHVFQHFEDLDIARKNFVEIARVLRPGGVMLVHLPIYRYPPFRLARFMQGAQHIERWAQDARARVRRQREKPLMRHLDFSLTWLFEELPAVGLADVEVCTFLTRSNGSIHECVLARRPVERQPAGP